MLDFALKSVDERLVAVSGLLHVTVLLLVAALLRIAISRLVIHRSLRCRGVVHRLVAVARLLLHLQLHLEQLDLLLLPEQS